MSDSTRVTPAPKKKRVLLRAMACVFGMLIVLLVVGFFVITSSAFFKGTILPRVGKAINAQITVSDASIKPFKQVVLHDLKIQTTGTEPLVSAEEVRLRYNLMDIIRGNIHVDEIKVASLTVSLVENPDGSSNLDSILNLNQTKDPDTEPTTSEMKPVIPERKPAAPETKSVATPKTSVVKPLQVDLKRFALTDATFRRVKYFADGTREVAELSHANLTIHGLKNGQTAQLVLGTDIHVQQTNAMLKAKLAGTFMLALTADLKPFLINGSTRLEVTQAEGALAEAAAFSSRINVEITPTEIKEMALRFQRGDANLGELRMSGPLDLQTREGRLSIVLADIDKQLLNLVGTSSGMDFGNTTISSTNEVELTQGGSMITAKGQLDVNAFQVAQRNLTTPQLDLHNAYDVTVDRSQSMATLRNLTVTGTQKGDALLKAELTSPMQISWGDVSNAVGDSAFNLTVSDFNLADWQPFVGEFAPAGVVNMMAKVLSQQGGKQLTLDLDSQVDHLTVNVGSNHIADVSVSLQARAKATDLKQFNLMDCRLEVAHQNEPLTKMTASGIYDAEKSAADMQVAVQAVLATALRIMPQPGMTVSSGTVEMKAHVSQKAQGQDGKELTLDLDSKIDQLTANIGSNHIADASVSLTAQAKATDLKQFNLIDCRLEVAHQNEPLTKMTASGTYDIESNSADMQVAVQATLATALRIMPQPGMTISSGTLEMNAHVTQKEKAQAFTGKLALANFSGQFGANALRDLGTTLDFDVGMASEKLTVRKFLGKLTQGNHAGGSFDLTASVDLATKSTDLTAKLVDINQNAVSSFLEPMLAEKTLMSVAINGNTTAQYDPQGASSVKADFQMTNLVVKDPKGQFPNTPLEAGMYMDASLRRQVADLRQLHITLTPTARAANKLQLTGQLDMSKPSAIQGNLKLAADSLDLTRYYDLFMGEKEASASATKSAPATASAPATKAAIKPVRTIPTASVPASVDVNKEPDPIKLPVSNFTVGTSISQLYLHDVEIADWQTTTKIDGGHVVVNPFTLTLNGAPVTATLDLDLGVPGWAYDLSFNAQDVPLTPLVDSFQPENRGTLGGTVIAEAHIAGAGITGTSFQKYLNGQFDINSTNLNLSANNVKNPILATLLNVVATIPELVQKPKDQIEPLLRKLVGGVIEKVTGTSVVSHDLQKSPIDGIVLQGTVNSGRVELQNAQVQSPSFLADVNGGFIELASVITNSTMHVPVSISLNRSIADRIGLVSASTPTNAVYVKVPDFLTLTGTVSAPKPKINPLALVETVAGVVKELRGSGRGVQSDQPGEMHSDQPAAATTDEPPAKAASELESLIEGLFRSKKK